MYIRKYNTADCESMAKLFYQTVHTINAKDYTKEQLDAWSTGKVDSKEWNKSFSEHNTVVAEDNAIIVGFGDVEKSGYLNRLYVHKDYQNQGIATAICDELEQSVHAEKITTHASITAVPFFERRGYKVMNEQTVVRDGVFMNNFVMEKSKGKLNK